MKFCKYCGRQLNDNEKCDCSEAIEFQHKKNRGIKLATIVGLPIVVVVFTVLIIISQIKYNPFDYTEVTFEGVDGFGEVYVEVDKNAMAEKIIGSEPKTFQKNIEWADKAYELFSGIDYTISQEEDLSNDDVITVTFNFTGKIANKFDSCSQDFTVTGLKEIQKVDAFDEKFVSFKFSGLDGEGYFEYERLSEDSFYQDCSYSLKDDSINGSIGNGTELEIVVDYDEWDAENNLKAPKEYSKIITVSGMPKTMTAEEVPEASVNEIKDYFIKNQTEMLKDYDDYKFNNINYYGTYYFTPISEDSIILPKTATKLIVYYSAIKVYPDNTKEKVYISIKYEKDRYDDYDGLVLYPDGSTNLQIENYNIDINAESIKEIISNDSSCYFSDAYTATKIY